MTIVYCRAVDFPKTAVDSTETLMEEAKNAKVIDKIDEMVPEDAHNMSMAMMDTLKTPNIPMV